MIAGVELLDCCYRVVGSLLQLWAMSEIIPGLAGTLGDSRMSLFIHYVWEKPLLFILILVGHDERSFFLQINITKDITSIVLWLKDFFMISFLCIVLLLTDFDSFTILISFNCKYPAGNCMLEVGDWDAGLWCWICLGLAVTTPERRHWCRSGVFIVVFGQVWHLALLCFCCWRSASKYQLGISNFNDKISFDWQHFWLIYFVVIFRSIRLFFTVNITNCNNYLILYYEIARIIDTLIWSLIWFWACVMLQPTSLFQCGLVG